MVIADQSLNEIPVSSGNKFALVVGINNSAYSYLPSLQYAERDADAIAQVLRTPECDFIILEPPLLSREAHTMAVKQALINLTRKRTDEDFLLFYFSGHAKLMNTSEGQEDIYLVTHDFREDEVEASSDMHLSMSWLWKLIYQRTQAGKVLLILDCCYAGNMVGAGLDPYQIDLRKLVEDYLDGRHFQVLQDRLRVILMATRDDATASEKDGHGLMTGLLLPALRGEVEEILDDEGGIDIASLFKYLKKRMHIQSPNLSVEYMGTDMSYILAKYPKLSARSRKEAEDKALTTLISKFQNQLSEFSKIIIDPDFFEHLAKSQHSQPFDHSLCKEASHTDLDQDKIIEFLKKDLVQLQQDFRPDVSQQEQLLQLGLFQESNFTYGTLLCFGRDPTKWVSAAFTRCTYWHGDDRQKGWQDDRTYRDGLLIQFEESLNFLRKSLQFSRRIDKVETTEQWEIPFLALREALANALVHREYANRTDFVHIEVFDNRVEISSPGDPPAPMTLELLEEEHKSHPRNPQIARIFYLYGYVEEVGSGIRRMQQAMQNAGLLPAEFNLNKAKTFKVILYRPERNTKGSFTRYDDVIEIARLLEARKANNSNTVLLLGARAGGLIRSSRFYEILQAFSPYTLDMFSHRKQFDQCYNLLQQLSIGERDFDTILRESLQTVKPALVETCVVELVKLGIFDVIISTNVDDLLEQSFAQEGMKEGYDYTVLLPGQEFSSREPFFRKSKFCQIIKAFGDLVSSNYKTAQTRSYLDDNQEFKRYLEEVLTRDVLMIGLDPLWDKDIIHAFPAQGGSVWFVNEEEPTAYTLISQALQGRKVGYIAGEQGEYERFFEALHQHLLARRPISHELLRHILNELRAIRTEITDLRYEFNNWKDDVKSKE